MRPSVVALTAMLLTAACATMTQASLENRTLSYGCSDIVAVGRVENGTYEHIQSEDDLLGRGSIEATLHVRKVVRGASLPAVVPVRYVAHSFMREDRDFMLVLRRSGSGLEITSGQLMSLRPLLASRCV